MWHVDGENESVVAVILYYYDIDEALVGGNMEFLDRRPLDMIGNGDTDAPRFVQKRDIREALRGTNNANTTSPRIPNCSVPVKTGTLLVFSNYQMAHRVLRMINTSREKSASRKFVALFVLDPAAGPFRAISLSFGRDISVHSVLDGMFAKSGGS